MRGCDMNVVKEDPMKIPDGKTCSDCAHFKRCEWLIQCKPDSDTCDWLPSRFLEARENDAEPAP